jgi:hypothetical protein
MVLVQFPFLGTKTINGTSRINQTVYHGFNNKLCKVKLLNYSLVFNKTVSFAPMLMRIDSEQLKPINMPIIDGNIFGTAIYLPIGELNVMNDDMSFECLLLGDSITVDVIEADAPLNDQFPFGSNTFIYGHLAFDITPVI